MKRVLLATITGLTVFGLVLGLAAGLPVTADQLGAGGAGVTACDPDGVDVSFGLLAGDVTSVTEVTVDGIDAGCAGQEMSVELTNSVTGSLLVETVTITATSEVVTLSSLVAAADIDGVNVTITGPAA